MGIYGHGVFFYLKEKVGKQIQMKRKKNRKKKIIIRILAVVLVLAVAVILAAGNYLVTFGITRKDTMTMNIVPEATTTSEAETTVVETYERLTDKLESWLQEAVWEQAEIVSEDDLKLKSDVV